MYRRTDLSLLAGGADKRHNDSVLGVDSDCDDEHPTSTLHHVSTRKQKTITVCALCHLRYHGKVIVIVFVDIVTHVIVFIAAFVIVVVVMHVVAVVVVVVVVVVLHKGLGSE